MDQQMYTNMGHVEMSYIVFPLYSHHKTNPTSSHQLSQIVPVRQEVEHILRQAQLIAVYKIIGVAHAKVIAV